MKKETASRNMVRSLSGRHRELARFLLARLPNEDDARDLAQETYLRMLRLNDKHLIRHPEAYLFRIASNLVHEYWLRSRTGFLDTSVQPDELPSSMQQPEVMAEQQQAVGALYRAIENLSPVQKSVVLKHRRDGKTYNEIAEELGISRDMVKKHLSKALARCRRYLVLRRYEY